MSEDYNDPELHNLPEEKLNRISICTQCPHNVMDVYAKCDQCDCPISALTMFTFKTCPLNKW